MLVSQEFNAFAFSAVPRGEARQGNTTSVGILTGKKEEDVEQRVIACWTNTYASDTFTRHGPTVYPKRPVY